MKHWHERGQLVSRLVRLERERRPSATVTRIEGSTYRRPGAKLLVEGPVGPYLGGDGPEQDAVHARA